LPAPEGGKASSRRLAVFSLSTAVSSSPRGPHGRFRRRRGSHSDRRLIVGADRRGAGCCGRRGKLGWSAGRHDESARTSCRCRLGRACGHGGPRYRCGRRSAAPGDSRREGRDRRTNAPVGAVTASAITGDDLPDLVTAAAGRLDIRAVLADGSLRPVLEQPIDVAAPQGIATLLDPDGLAILDRASRAMTFLEVSDFGTVDRRHPLVVTGRAPLGDDPVAMGVPNHRLSGRRRSLRPHRRGRTRRAGHSDLPGGSRTARGREPRRFPDIGGRHRGRVLGADRRGWNRRWLRDHRHRRAGPHTTGGLRSRAASRRLPLSARTTSSTPSRATR
jgi:hypothetical protein